MSTPTLQNDLLESLGSAADHLTIGGLRADELAQRHGSPLYVFDAQGIRERVKAVQNALGERVQLLFALKANPNASIARTIRKCGTGCDVASLGELLIAQTAGFSGSQIQFAGPGKTEQDLSAALAAGVTINVESEPEFALAADLARNAGQTVRVAFRVHPEKGVGGSRMRMGGGRQKFGLEPAHVAELVRRAVQDESVELRGLHLYGGTQCFDAAAWLDTARYLLEVARTIESSTGATIGTINFGGGFGVPCFDGDKVFDLKTAGAGIRSLIEDDARPERQYFVELGRYLVATSGVYLTRVTYLKTLAGIRHVILDGGLHHHAAAAGVGAVIRRPFPVVRCRAPFDTGADGVCLGGPLCTPADDLGQQVRLPDLEQGDLLAFLASGAYGLTFSNVLFLSHPMPAEVLVDGGQSHVIRQPGSHEDVLRGQTIAPD